MKMFSLLHFFERFCTLIILLLGNLKCEGISLNRTNLKERVMLIHKKKESSNLKNLHTFYCSSDGGETIGEVR